MLTFLLLFAPIFRGGNRQIAMSVLLAAGLALGMILLASGLQVSAGRRIGAERNDRFEWTEPSALWFVAIAVLASSPLWLGLVQLFPFYSPKWASLAGRDLYATGLTLLGGEPVQPSRHALSLNPSVTWPALWSAVPVSVTFIAALVIDRRSTKKLFLALLFVGVIQVILALTQLARGPSSLFMFGSIQGTIGTFNNRNHLADYLAMLIPVWCYLVTMKDEANSEFLARRRLTIETARPFLAIIGFAFLVVVLATQSRGGLVAALGALLLSAGILFVQIGYAIRWRARLAIFLVLLAFALAAAVSVGLDKSSERFAHQQLAADADVRAAYAMTTFQAAKTLWPWGSGVGSFESVFPRFQARTSLGYVNEAHNDYAQLVMELGAPAVLIGGLLLTLVIHQLWRLWASRLRGDSISQEAALRLFAGSGAAAMLTHSWVEYNMHIPTLALTASFLMGVFLRPLPTKNG